VAGLPLESKYPGLYVSTVETRNVAAAVHRVDRTWLRHRFEHASTGFADVLGFTNRPPLLDAQ
jgi:hypothetical protein